MTNREFEHVMLDIVIPGGTVILVVCIGLLTWAAITPAHAGCPWGTKYECSANWGGKGQSCGCR